MITFKSTTKTLKKPEKTIRHLQDNKYPKYEVDGDVKAILQRMNKSTTEVARLDSVGTVLGLPAPYTYTYTYGKEKYSQEIVPAARNAFLDAVHNAFDKHYPLALSPDDFWLCITQGFATHVKMNAEALRNRFVAHEGKHKLIIIRDWFKGDASNDWAGAFSEFSDQIKSYIGKTRDMLVSDFSTTTLASRAASEVVLMDAMSQYFSYGCRTSCGIPEITLLGSVDDWKSVRNRAAVLTEYCLADWGKYLLEVLDNVVESAKGNAKPEFWESFFHLGGGSGGPFVTGWINALFPYLGNDKENPYATGKTKPRARDGWDNFFASGPNIDDFGLGISEVEMDWEAFVKNSDGKLSKEMFDMKLTSGFLAFSQEEDSQIIRPCIGWGVQDKATQTKVTE